MLHICNPFPVAHPSIKTTRPTDRHRERQTDRRKEEEKGAAGGVVFVVSLSCALPLLSFIWPLRVCNPFPVANLSLENDRTTDEQTGVGGCGSSTGVCGSRR